MKPNLNPGNMFSMEVDFSTLPYGEWLDLIFNRPVDPLREWSVEAVFEPADPITLVKHLTRLCLEFSELPNRFSWEQIDQGVWAVLMYPVETVQYLMTPAIPHETRAECIRSMFEVFSGTVAHIPADIPMETCFFMWWDIVAKRFCGHLSHWDDAAFVPDEENHRRTHDVIFETLVRILNLDDARCHNCALHGLGHLHHPKVAQVVQEYIDTHMENSVEEGVEWLKQCRDGTVM